MREKLVELMDEYLYPLSVEGMAEHLIANGVTIPVRCKDCKHKESYDALLYCGHIRGLAGSVAPDGFCSYGERKDNGSV